MPHAGHAGQVANAVNEQRRKEHGRSRSVSVARNPQAAGHFSAALNSPLKRPATRASIQVTEPPYR